MGNPVVHFEVTGQDGSALRDFYSRLLGWEFQVMEAMNCTASWRRRIAESEGVSAGAGRTGARLFYVEVDAPTPTRRRVPGQGRNARRHDRHADDGDTVVVTFALLADPEGHMVGGVKVGRLVTKRRVVALPNPSPSCVFESPA